MKYIFYFDIAAVVLTFALLMICWMRRSYPTVETRLFCAVAISNGIACSADIVTAFTISFPSLVPLWANYLFNILYLAGNVLTAAFYLHYVLLITGIDKRIPVLKKCMWAVFFVVLLGAVSSPATHLVFYFDESGTYLHGAFFPTLYVATLVFMAVCAGCLLSSMSKLSTYQVIPPVVSIGVVFAAMGIQVAMPYLLLEGFSVAVMLVLTYSVVEANSKYMHKGSYCYNYLAFRDTFDKTTAKKRSFSVIAFGFDDMPYARNTMDLFSVQELMLQVADALLGEFGQKSVFYLRDCRFAVICSMQDEDNTIARVEQTLKRARARGGLDARLEPCFCVLRQPGLVETGCEADDAIVYALQDREEKGGEHVIRVDGSSFAEKRREGIVIRAMREAITQDGFNILLQPIRNTRTNRFDSAEVLARLDSDELGVVGPGEFIPLAESAGMIGQISDRIFEKACRLWCESNMQSLGVKYLEVNLSAAQCLENGVADKLLGIIERYGLEPENINLEITETVLLALDERALGELSTLHEAGVNFSLDDYGSGYASAVNLYTLPLDMVKIDKSLVWDSMDDPKAMTVLKAFISLCDMLGKEVVAEGIETQEMADALCMLGAQHLQGYLYAHPMLPKDYFAFLSVAAKQQ